MKSREDLQQEFAGAPAGLLEYACQLQAQLDQQEHLLAPSPGDASTSGRDTTCCTRKGRGWIGK